MKETNNGELTPKAVKEAFSNLPSNYVIETQKVLKAKHKAGIISKTYSNSYIQKVKKEEKYNEDILLALYEVGKSNMEKKTLFGFKKEKTPSTK